MIRTGNPTTTAAFLSVVLLGGLNGVAVRFSNRELAPFWGATLRFGIAAIVLLGIVRLRRVPFPGGAALTGSLLYGVFGFAGAFGFIYWGLVATPAGLAQVVLALVPLLTFLFAVAQGLERFRPQALAGSLLALAGIVVVFGQRLGSNVPTVSMLAILLAAACMAESNVVVKRFPKCHPVANNAVAMSTGAVILLVLSFVTREAHALPGDGQTWVAVFSLFLYVIQRWTASATSYVMLLMPLVTVSVAAAIAGESVALAFLAGGAFVLAGVYVAAFAPPIARGLPVPALFRGPRSAARQEPPNPVQPGCA